MRKWRFERNKTYIEFDSVNVPVDSGLETLERVLGPINIATSVADNQSSGALACCSSLLELLKYMFRSHF